MQEMIYHSSRVCAYCRSEFMGHVCTNCGAPYTPDVRHSPGESRIVSSQHYRFGWTDWRKKYYFDEEGFTSGEL